MVAATEINRPDGLLAEENVMLEASDGETFETTLSTVFGVHIALQTASETRIATWGNYDDNPVAVTFVAVSASVSGQKITLHGENLINKRIFVTVRGRR